MLDLSMTAGLWVTASKTKIMRVKHISAVLSDLNVANHIFVRTLEGDQRVLMDRFVCLGIKGEMWQQSHENLFKKYDFISCDANGWWIARPKDGNTVDALRITPDLVPLTDFSIRALWGDQADDGSYYQTGKVGDWVLRSRENPEDMWIVRADIFDATYEVVQ